MPPTQPHKNNATPTRTSLLALLLAAHTLVELPASLTFFLDPSLTLSTNTEGSKAAYGVIRQYGVLLLTLNLLLWTTLHYRHVLSAALRPFPAEARRLRIAAACSIALYHVACTVRAITRVRAGEGSAKGLGGPWLHGLLHGGLGLGLLLTAGWEVLRVGAGVEAGNESDGGLGDREGKERGNGGRLKEKKW